MLCTSYQNDYSLQQFWRVHSFISRLKCYVSYVDPLGISLRNHTGPPGHSSCRTNIHVSQNLQHLAKVVALRKHFPAQLFWVVTNRIGTTLVVIAGFFQESVAGCKSPVQRMSPFHIWNGTGVFDLKHLPLAEDPRLLPTSTSGFETLSPSLCNQNAGKKHCHHGTQVEAEKMFRKSQVRFYSSLLLQLLHVPTCWNQTPKCTRFGLHLQSNLSRCQTKAFSKEVVVGDST